MLQLSSAQAGQAFNGEGTPRGWSSDIYGQPEGCGPVVLITQRATPCCGSAGMGEGLPISLQDVQSAVKAIQNEARLTPVDTQQLVLKLA